MGGSLEGVDHDIICEYPSYVEKWTNEKERAETKMDTILATVKSLRALGAANKQKKER